MSEKRVDNARAAVLYLGGVGAIAAAMTATVLRTSGLPQVVVPTVGAVCLAVVTFVAARFLTPAEFRRWSRARAVAESINQVIYRFRARARPSVRRRCPAEAAPCGRRDRGSRRRSAAHRATHSTAADMVECRYAGRPDETSAIHQDRPLPASSAARPVKVFKNLDEHFAGFLHLAAALTRFKKHSP
ncbi:DUF4231 domain-containing protein [Rhodococcus wratislaviensis]|uniref:DUF4231 domain-containing protein n=1 Tax=Rhodococcus wratislaviensis TaxID=44752 RepID=UPI0037C6AFDE